MKTLRIAFALLFMAAFSQTAQAQDFKSAIGLRFGSPWALSYKTFISESSAIEAFLGYRNYGYFTTGYNYFQVGALYQIHKPLGDTEGFSYYFGGGASVSFWSYPSEFNSIFDDFSTISPNVHGNLGLSYTFSDTPINLTLDVLPTLSLGNTFIDSFGFGYTLGARYVLGR